MATRMDVIAAAQFYIDKIASDATIGGMKVLIMDSATMKIASMVYSQTQILEKTIYLTETLGTKKLEKMFHLKAAVFIQPTEVNLNYLIDEIRDPTYSDYHIFFSNIVPDEFLQRLAREDTNEIIKQVHEYYADFVPINEDFFHLGAKGSIGLSAPIRNLQTDQVFKRNVDGLLSVLLATKRKPCQIRYQSNSDLCRRMATDAADRIDHDGIFMFQNQGPILLFLDRKDDPITPLLTQWTYQAMVHELLGLNYNRVSLKSAPGVKDKDLQEVVLSCTQDSFFAKNRFSNFGDLGSAIKAMLDEYQRDSKQNEKIQSIEDMQRFMDRYPAFRSRGINVSKHVAVMSELARLTDVCRLLDISQFEQEMACQSDHSAHRKILIDMLNSNAAGGGKQIQTSDKLRLSILYLLKYESYNEVNEIRVRLTDAGLLPEDVAVLSAVLNYAGESQRAQGLFSSGNNLVAQFQKAFVNLNGVENVYTQHEPLLCTVLDQFLKNKQIKDSTYPNAMNQASGKANELIIFVVGGVTFEEATKVAEFNATNQGLRVTLGGSYIHNSNSFLKEIATAFN